MRDKLISPLLIMTFVLVAAAGCQTTPTQDGALLGGALGAIGGAVAGHQVGKQGEGALIGAGAGALLGALIGDALDEAGYGRASAQPGQYQMRVVTAPSGEKYEERVWVPDP